MPLLWSRDDPDVIPDSRVRERRYPAVALATRKSALASCCARVDVARVSIAPLSVAVCVQFSCSRRQARFSRVLVSVTGIVLITSGRGIRGGFIGAYVVGFVTRQTAGWDSGMRGLAGISLIVSAALATRLPRRLTA